MERKTAAGAKRQASWDRESTSTSSTLRFDSLPDVALESIVRKLSKKPRSEEWYKQIAHKDIASLLRLGGELNFAVRSAICDLHVSDTGRPLPREEVNMVIAELGENLRRFELTSSCVPDTLASHCTGLRHLNLDLKCDLAGLSPRLVTLFKKQGPELRSRFCTSANF